MNTFMHTQIHIYKHIYHVKLSISFIIKKRGERKNTKIIEQIPYYCVYLVLDILNTLSEI